MYLGQRVNVMRPLTVKHRSIPMVMVSLIAGFLKGLSNDNRTLEVDGIGMTLMAIEVEADGRGHPAWFAK
jgi:hypothetical protein